MIEFAYRNGVWKCAYLIAPMLNWEDREILLRGICDNGYLSYLVDIHN